MPAAMAGVIGQNGLPLSDNSSVTSLSYSEVSEVRPKSNQAVILELLDNKEINNEKYIDALLEIVKAEEITHISRISRNRMCVYLTTADKATSLVDVNKYVIVEGEEVKISPLVARSVKVTISNADASISNTAIKRYLNLVCKIRTSSSVSELKINSISERIRNVFSFRRVVYIHPEDVDKLPSSQKFKGDGTTWNVFFNTGNPKCFICSAEDHLAKQCPSNFLPTQEEENQEITDVSNKKIEMSETADELSLNLDSNDSSQTSPAAASQIPLTSAAASNALFSPTVPKIKRPLSTSSSVSSSQNSKKSNSNNNNKTIKPSARDSKNQTLPQPTYKKQKKEERKEKMTFEELKEQTTFQLENARSLIEIFSSSLGPNFEDMANLIASSAGLSAKSKRENAIKYFKTGKKDEIINLLRQIHSLVSGKGIKSRVTNIIKALSLEDDVMATEESEEDSPRVFNTPTPSD